MFQEENKKNNIIKGRINEVYIENFKCIEKERLGLRNLTIIAGPNSSGKTALIQAILFAGNYKYNNKIKDYMDILETKELFNKNTNAKNMKIEVKFDNPDFPILKREYNIEQGDLIDIKYPNPLTLENNLFYLSADRIRAKKTNVYKKDEKVGIEGEYIIGYYFKNKDAPLPEYLIYEYDEDEEEGEEVLFSLESQVNYWLNKILSIDIEFVVEEYTKEQIRAFYKNPKKNYTIFPENLGTGVSYLVTILIVCLLAQKGNIIIIENPEIHLHPRAQAMIGEFFSFIASKGIQLIIETHNDHLINKICYAQYKKILKRKEVLIYYKEDEGSKFEKIEIKKGKLLKNFPGGFFDATLKEVLEINRS